MENFVDSNMDTKSLFKVAEKIGSSSFVCNKELSFHHSSPFSKRIKMLCRLIRLQQLNFGAPIPLPSRMKNISKIVHKF